MTENQRNLGRRKIDAGAFVDADNMYEEYHRKDPGITREMAQQAVMHAMREARELDSRHVPTGYSKNPIMQERLRELGIDPDTLEVLPK